jgi:hypothetical protein
MKLGFSGNSALETAPWNTISADGELNCVSVAAFDRHVFQKDPHVQ